MWVGVYLHVRECQSANVRVYELVNRLFAFECVLICIFVRVRETHVLRLFTSGCRAIVFQ